MTCIYNDEGYDFGTFSMRWVISIIVHLLSFLLPGANNTNNDKNEKNTSHSNHCSNYCLGIIITVVVIIVIII